MLGNLLGGLFDKEKAIYSTVQDALTSIAEELQLPYSDFFIAIRPVDSEYNHKYFICKYDEKGQPKAVREITLKEIIAEDE